MTNSSSIPIVSPKPSQFLHAPNGLLKLNKWIEGSINLSPSISKLFEKEVSSFESKLKTEQIPPPS